MGPAVVCGDIELAGGGQQYIVIDRNRDGGPLGGGLHPGQEFLGCDSG